MSEIRELEKLHNLKSSLETTLSDIDAQIEELEHKSTVTRFCQQFKEAYILHETYPEEDDDTLLWGLRLFVHDSLEKPSSLDAQLTTIPASEAHMIDRHTDRDIEGDTGPYEHQASVDENPLRAVTIWTSFEKLKTLIEQCSFEEIENNNKKSIAQLETDSEGLKDKLDKLKIKIEILKKEDEELEKLMRP